MKGELLREGVKEELGTVREGIANRVDRNKSEAVERITW